LLNWRSDRPCEFIALALRARDDYGDVVDAFPRILKWRLRPRFIVDDEVDIEGRRDIGLDMLEKGHELLLVAMSCAALRKDPAIGNVEGCEQGRRAVPDVIVGAQISFPTDGATRRTSRKFGAAPIVIRDSAIILALGQLPLAR
jgi:hypothetical protein